MLPLFELSSVELLTAIVLLLAAVLRCFAYFYQYRAAKVAADTAKAQRRQGTRSP